METYDYLDNCMPYLMKAIEEKKKKEISKMSSGNFFLVEIVRFCYVFNNKFTYTSDGIFNGYRLVSLLLATIIKCALSAIFLFSF